MKQKRVDSKMVTDEWTAFASRLNGRYNKVTANGRSILREWKKTILIVSSIRHLWRSAYLSRGNNTKNVVYHRGSDFFFIKISTELLKELMKGAGNLIYLPLIG